MYIFIYFLLLFVAFVFTIKSTPEKILNRDQTEEWKGWMQVCELRVLLLLFLLLLLLFVVKVIAALVQTKRRK